MKKKLFKPFLTFLAFILVFSFSTSFAAANTIDPDEQEKITALDNSSFYNVKTNEVIFSRDIAKSYYDFTEEELDAIEEEYSQLTQDQIDLILDINGIDLED